jgi:D-glycero-D-manno-heptose 1,7-bisphosphate phosphatase
VVRAVDGAEPAPARRAAFLDRDGTLNEAVPDAESESPESPLSVEDVRLIRGAPEAVRELADAGYALVCVTNQPAAAKGKATLRQLLDVHERVIELLVDAGIRLAVSRLCPHHPDGIVAELSGPCDCRKPAPGMLLESACELELDLSRCWMMGDTDNDVGAGLAAGCRTALIDYPPTAHKRLGGAEPDIFVPDIGVAVAQLLDHHRR